VAIERPSGLLVDTLVDADFTVVPIHPNAVKASRPRYRSHGGKSDASDAYVLADLLRTDGHRFKALTPQSDEIRALRALVRGRDDLVATRVHLANQLRTLLESFWPGAAAVFADIDSPIALAFIERYPTPQSASRLGPKRMAAFCAQHAYCGRRSPDDLLARLQEAPSAVSAETEMEAKGELARCVARTLTRLVEQLRLLSSRIEHLVASLDDGRILMSFPRAGRICAAHGTSRENILQTSARLRDLVANGVAVIDGTSLAVADDARFLVRSVAAAFDAHLEGSAMRHSRAV